MLLAQIVKYKKWINATALELRTLRSDNNHLDLPLVSDQYFLTHILNIRNDLDIIKSFFHKRCIQRPLRKIKKNGLLLHVSEDCRDLKTFYRLHTQARKKHGVPVQPYRYFLNMWDQLHSKGHMDLFLAIHRGDAIAGIIILKYKNTVIYQNGASDEQFLKLHPNHFLLWNAIKNAQAGGYSCFDFGRSSVDDDGLVKFKDRWGT